MRIHLRLFTRTPLPRRNQPSWTPRAFRKVNTPPHASQCQPPGQNPGMVMHLPSSLLTKRLGRDDYRRDSQHVSRDGDRNRHRDQRQSPPPRGKGAKTDDGRQNHQGRQTANAAAGRRHVVTKGPARVKNPRTIVNHAYVQQIRAPPKRRFPSPRPARAR